MRTALVSAAVVLASTLTSPPGLRAQAVLNEINARNATGLKDEDGESRDWVEIKNLGASSLDVGGYYLTDDPTALTKWKLPSTRIAAGSYLVVFASGKNRAVSGRNLHTNFRMDGDGEYLALVWPDGRTVASAFAPRFPEQRTNVSWGRRSGGGFAYFPQPTPWSGNGRGVSGLVADTVISVASGFADNPFATAITTATPGAAIRYTTNGSVPTQSSRLYTGPIAISTNTVLRARAFKQDHVASLVDTRTYLFVEAVVRQPARPSGFPTRWGGAPAADYEMDPQIVNDAAYRQDVRRGLRAIPTLSIVLETADMFGSRGIYSNTRSSGIAWERVCSAELFGANDADFRLDCGVRVQGGASRSPSSSPKHSFSLRFRNRYGQGQLRTRLFPGSRVKDFDSLHLRMGYNNSWIHWAGSQRTRGMMIRDQWVRDALIEMGQADAGHGRHVHLYINSLYWGVCLLQERQEAAHYAAWHGGDEDDYDARNGSRFVQGNSSAWNAMVATVRSRNWSAIQNVLDVEHYIDWMIIQSFSGNSDLKSNGNWRAAGGGPSRAPWRMYSWDAERVLESPNAGGPRPSSDPPGLYNDLIQIREFVVRFGDRLHRHFFNGGALTPKSAAAPYTTRAARLDLAIVAESARWGDYRRDVHRSRQPPYELYTRNGHFRPELSRLTRSYFPSRSRVVFDRYRRSRLYPSTAAPTFGQHGGRVPNGFKLSMSASNTIYYTLDGTDPRLPGGRVSGRAVRYTSPATITKTTTVKARALTGSSWSALNEALFVVGNVTINEVLASNQNGIRDNAGEREDWIEIYNSGSSAVDVGEYYLTDRANELTKWRLPKGQSIPAGGTLLIWADEDGRQGPLHANFKLSTSGEQVLLVYRDGETLIDRFDFGPQVADVSTGRFFDGGPRLVTFPDPSPRRRNEVAGCASRRYSALDSRLQPIALSLEGRPALGQRVTFVLSGGPASTLHGMFVAPFADEVALPFTGARLLLSNPFYTFAVATSSSSGTLRVPFTVPQLPFLAGKSLCFQGFSATAAGIDGSGGLEVAFCR